MFEKLKQNLYFSKLQLLLAQGEKKGEILPFEDELYDRLNEVYFNGIPLSIHLKFLKPTMPPGQCYDRSLWITMGFENAILVRGDIKSLELSCGKDSAGHGWVENDGWVYDPTSLLKFKKELYYKMFLPQNVHYYSCKEYSSHEWYQDIINTSLEDLQPHGKKRPDLCVSIPLVQGIAEMSGNNDFINQLNNHLSLIDYDIVEVQQELNDAVQAAIRFKQK